MSPVAYNASNLQKCRCGACPVHNTSQCVAGRMAGMQAAMQPAMAGQPGPSMGGGTAAQPGAQAQAVRVPDPDLMEGVYCSQAVGKSPCNDLNGRLACVCPTCAVWTENNLTTNYFCIHGAAGS